MDDKNTQEEIGKLQIQHSDLLYCIDTFEIKKKELEESIKNLTEINNRKLSENKLISQSFITELEGRNKLKHNEFLLLDKHINDLKISNASLGSDNKYLSSQNLVLKNELEQVLSSISEKKKELNSLARESESKRISNQTEEKSHSDEIGILLTQKDCLASDIQTKKDELDKMSKDKIILSSQIGVLVQNKDLAHSEFLDAQNELNNTLTDIIKEKENISKLRDESLQLVRKHLYIDSKAKELKKFADKAGVPFNI